jgi:putative ATP-grasp target RiPP
MTTHATASVAPGGFAPVPFGVRQAVAAVPLPVDLSTIHYDPDRQISVITEDGVTVPALKHSTGTTSTNTAVQDNKGGPDRDIDHTED